VRRPRRGPIAATAAAAALLLVACSGSPKPISLDGSPHPPTDAGVVTVGNRHEIVLDGKRRYGVNPQLIVFTPGSLELAPLAGAVGRYALIGARHGRVDWVEPLSAVVDLPTPTVLFFGLLTRVSGPTLTFSDGTVLTLAPGVRAPKAPESVRADIDPTTHHVRDLVGS